MKTGLWHGVVLVCVIGLLAVPGAAQQNNAADWYQRAIEAWLGGDSGEPFMSEADWDALWRSRKIPAPNPRPTPCGARPRVVDVGRHGARLPGAVLRLRSGLQPGFELLLPHIGAMRGIAKLMHRGCDGAPARRRHDGRGGPHRHHVQHGRAFRRRPRADQFARGTGDLESRRQRVPVRLRSRAVRRGRVDDHAQRAEPPGCDRSVPDDRRAGHGAGAGRRLARGQVCIAGGPVRSTSTRTAGSPAMRRTISRLRR
jgi:hypothetical protein